MQKLKYASNAALEESMKFSETTLQKGKSLVMKLAEEVNFGKQGDLLTYSRIGEFTEDEIQDFKRHYASNTARTPETSNTASTPENRIQEAILMLSGWQPGTAPSIDQEKTLLPSNIKKFHEVTENLGYPFFGAHVDRCLFYPTFESFLSLCAYADVPENQKEKYFRLVKTLAKKKLWDIPLSMFSESSAISAIPDDIFETYLLAIEGLESDSGWDYSEYLSVLKKRNALLIPGQFEELVELSKLSRLSRLRPKHTLSQLSSLAPTELEIVKETITRANLNQKAS